MNNWDRSIQAGLLAVVMAGTPVHAQTAPGQPQTSDQDRGDGFWRFFREGEWYFSWGYSKQYWAPSDIHVSQPALGNDFTIHDVAGHDEPGGESGIFQGDLFGPQYNIRIGRFINADRTLGVELNFDHSKYTTTVGQTAQVTGLVAGVPTNAYTQLTNQFFSEQLHNGANHVMVNAVYRLPLIGQTNETLSVAAIAKAGVGIMLPHTGDTILGETNNVGNKTLSNAIGLNNGWWQLNGWTTGAEFGLRFVLFKPVYLELTDKVAYARLGDLPAYQGTIQQNLLMNEIVLSLGFTYDGASAGAR